MPCSLYGSIDVARPELTRCPADFIPILGHLDDVILVPGLIWLALAIIPRSVKQDAREAASKEPSR